MAHPSQTGTAPEAFVRATLALVDVLNRETDALNRHDLEGISSLVDEKTAAAYDCEKAAAAFLAWRQTGEILDSKDSERLRTATDLLRQAAKENERRVRAAREAHKQIIDLVRDATNSAAPSSGAYGRGGSVTASRATRAAAPSLRFQSTA